MKSIKGFVSQRLRDGADVEQIAREAQERFPLNCASRGYVMKVKRVLESSARCPDCGAPVASIFDHVDGCPPEPPEGYPGVHFLCSVEPGEPQ